MSAFIIGVSAALPSSAHASSFLVPAKTLTISVGSTFSLPVTIDPMGETQYTVKFSATFPDVLEATSFQFASGWIPVSQPEYDVVDNKRGELVKAAGFPRGFSSTRSFGVITFRAKRAGEAVVTVGPQSFILNAESKNTLQTTSRVRVVITENRAAISVPSVTGSQPFPVEATSSVPGEERNLFDITAEPQRTEPRNPALRYGGFLMLGILAAIIGVLIARYGSRWNARKRQKS